MKTSAIVCAVLAGTFGLGGVASAQGMYGQGDRGDRRHEQRAEQGNDHRQGRQEQRWDQRQEQRWDQRRDQRGDQRGWQGNHQANPPRHVYQQPRYEAPRHVYQQPRYDAPRYVYQQPNYRASNRFYRGGYLPHQYRQPVYYVNNWNAYPSLYAPPYGHQWMNVDGEFLLVALATGLIANALIN